MASESVMAMYEDAQTVVRMGERDSRAFDVKAGLHQASVLSPLLFVVVIEVITKSCGKIHHGSYCILM